MTEQPPIPGSFAEFHQRLGSLPLDRIFMRPPPGTATEGDLIAAWECPEHHRCELVDGTLIQKFGSFHGAVLIGTLTGTVGKFVIENDLGITLMGNLPFRLHPGLIRCPSFTFTPWKRFPNGKIPDEKIASFVPALFVELPNATNTEAELQRKVEEYFAAGCKLAWVIDFLTKTAKVYLSPKRFKELDETGTLEGGKVLPGFKLTLAELFASTKRQKKTPR